MTTFQMNLIKWLKEAKAELEADGVIPTVDELLERAEAQIEIDPVGEKEVDNEPADFTGAGDPFGTDR